MKHFIFDVILGVSSIFLSFVAQVDVTALPIERVITQFGGLGLAVWLVIHHTMVTVPNLQRQHREERAEILEDFRQDLKDKHEFYQMELNRQREDFQKLIERSSCRWNNDTNR